MNTCRPRRLEQDKSPKHHPMEKINRPMRLQRRVVQERSQNYQYGCVLAVLRIQDFYSGSRILIFTHPGSRISDPKTATKEMGEKKLVVMPFYKIEIILLLKC